MNEYENLLSQMYIDFEAKYLDWQTKGYVARLESNEEKIKVCIYTWPTPEDNHIVYLPFYYAGRKVCANQQLIL